MVLIVCGLRDCDVMIRSGRGQGCRDKSDGDDDDNDERR